MPKRQSKSTRKQSLSQEELESLIPELLENPVFIDGLEADRVYERTHDDHDGTFIGKIRVQFSVDGDAWITTDQHRGPALRFRNFFGGGQSLRVWNALRILALAIKLDEQEHPEQH